MGSLTGNSVTRDLLKELLEKQETNLKTFIKEHNDKINGRLEKLDKKLDKLQEDVNKMKKNKSGGCQDLVKVEDAVQEVSLSSSPNSAKQKKKGKEENWQSSNKILELVKDFHERHAKFPEKEINEAKVTLERHLKAIHEKLKNKNLSKRLEYTGSSYEKVKIVTSTLEFDVMLIRDGKNLETHKTSMVEGYAFLKPLSDASVDGVLLTDWCLDPDMVTKQFFGEVQKAINELGLGGELKIQKHGSTAVNLEVSREGEKWFDVDLVPCYEVSENGEPIKFVPKPPAGADSDKLLWRRSYSIEEKEKMLKIDKSGNGCRRKCLRIMKALLHHETALKTLTTYYLKTALFNMCDEKKDAWGQDDLVPRLLDLMERLETYLSEQKMPHYYVPSINLLKDINEKALMNTRDRLKVLRTNENKFTKAFEK